MHDRDRAVLAADDAARGLDFCVLGVHRRVHDTRACKVDACVTFSVRDRRGIVRHRGGQGARPARDRLRLLREVRPGGRELGLPQHQRDVVGLPVAAHQHLARPDGVLGLPDAGRLSGLPAPHAGRGLLRRLRRPLRPAREDHVRDRRRARGAARRRLARARSDTASSATTARCWSPTATTGTRAGRSRFPGTDVFEGVQMHSHHYLGDDPALFAGKRVVVLGMGNSAMDIAVEATQTAERVFLAARRGAWIVPKYVFGRPLDQFVTAARVPLAVRQRFMETTLRAAVGTMERYGLPKPDHRPLEAHPTISDTILTRLTHGDITPKPNIARLTETAWSSPTAARSRADVVVYGTGYKVSFPFFDPALVSAPDNDLPLYRRVFHPDAGRPVLHRAAAAAGRDDAAGRGAVGVDLRPPDRPLRAAAARRAAADIARERAAHAQALRRLQAPHDAGRLRRLPVRAPARAQARREAGVEPARGDQGGQPRGDPRRRARGLRRARLRGRRACATWSAARTSPPGTFYNYFDGKDAVFRAVVEEVGAEARRRSARRAWRRRTTFVAEGFRAFFAFIAAEPDTFAFLERNADAVLPLALAELARGPRRAAARRASTSSYSAHAMVAVGLEIGGLMLAREPADVERATAFAAGLFRGPRWPLASPGFGDAFPFSHILSLPAYSRWRCRPPPRPPSPSASPRTSRRCSATRCSRGWASSRRG